MTIGRNDMCYCNSGKKYKNCCLKKEYIFEFYYDEIFHDRILTNKELTNYFVHNSSDSFCYAFIGSNGYKLQNIRVQFENLEKKYKTKLSIPDDTEFKSTTFSLKYYKNGVQSFNKDCLKFYDEYINILLNNDVKILFGALSKTSLLVYRFLCNLNIPLELHNMFKVIGYTLSKFLFTYKFVDIFDKLLNNSVTETKKEIIKKIEYIVEKNKNISRKEMENPCLETLIRILNQCSVADDNIISSWDYSIAFQSLNENLTKWNIRTTQTNIVIDNEKSTYKSAKEFIYNEIFTADSKSSSMIRAADFLVGMLARFVKSIENCLLEVEKGQDEEIENSNFANNIYLAEDWFRLNKEQFQFSIKLYNLFKSTNFASYIMFFGDDFIYLFSYMSYIASYKCYEEFINVSNENHKLKLNAYTMFELQNYFNKMNAEMGIANDNN